VSRPARRLLGIVLVCGALCAAGCGSTPRATLSATPRVGAADAPLRITVGGAPKGAVVRARTTDERGLAFPSETSVADVRRDPAKPLWSLRHGDDPWREPLPDFDVRLDLVDGGRTLASATVKRQVATPGVRGSDVGRRLVGRVFRPAGKPRGPAVLVFGGSEGGLGGVTISATLASHGHTAMALAYFGELGLPDTLREIPLEYFARAIKTLREEGRPVVVMGVSRGGEAALLLGATYPRLVRGVVALVPSNVVNGAGSGRGAAWTLNGRPVPYATVPGDPTSYLEPEALIRAERTRGPILTVSAGHDALWPSPGYTDALHARLDHRHFRFEHRDIRVADAGHLVGGALPYRPIPSIPEAGGSPAADAAGRAAVWPQILRFIDGL
jgi:dienelactone hydrolase